MNICDDNLYIDIDVDDDNLYIDMYIYDDMTYNHPTTSPKLIYAKEYALPDTGIREANSE